jgi:hypothetical protein
VGRRRLVVVTALALNIFSHSLASLAYREGLASLALLEVGVLVVEAVGFRLVAGLGWRRSAGIALLANLPTALLAWALA